MEGVHDPGTGVPIQEEGVRGEGVRNPGSGIPRGKGIRGSKVGVGGGAVSWRSGLKGGRSLEGLAGSIVGEALRCKGSPESEAPRW